MKGKPMPCEGRLASGVLSLLGDRACRLIDAAGEDHDCRSKLSHRFCRLPQTHSAVFLMINRIGPDALWSQNSQRYVAGTA